MESECTSSINLRSTDIGIDVVLIREVLVHNVERFLIDLQVIVLLEVVDGDHSTGLLDIEGVLVDSAGSRGNLVGLTDPEDVVEAIEGDLDDLVVHHRQEVAEGLDAALANEVPNDIGLLQATRGGVGNRPACLLSGLEIGMLEDVDKRRDDVGINDSLDLWRGASGDVGDGPASFLTDAVLGRRQERKQGRKSTGGDNNLGLEVVTSDNISTDRRAGV